MSYRSFLSTRPSTNRSSNSNGRGYRSFKLALRDAFMGPYGSQSPDMFDESNPAGISAGEGFQNELLRGIRNLWRGATGSGLTDRDIQMNQMNMKNVEDTAAAQVSGYLKAGVNPALMYGSGGQQTAPNSSATGSGSFSDLMQVLMLPAQIKLMNAQAKNTDANTQKQISETEQIKQVMQFYPRLTEHTIAEITSRTGLNLTNISKVEADIAIAEFEKIIKGNEAKYSDEFYRLRNRVEEATELNQKASALDAYMKALWTEYETQYTKTHNGARPSSSSLLALADAVMSWLGVDGSEVGGAVTTVVERVVSEIGADGDYSGSLANAAGRSLAGDPWKIKGKTLVEHGKSLWSRGKRALTGRGLIR